MKNIIFLKMIIINVVLLVSIGWTQEDTIFMRHEELKPHKRSAVVFPHARHSESIDCSRCHHDYDNFGVNTNTDGQKCSECHTRTSKYPMPLMKAIHLQCKGCHEKLSKTVHPGLPVLCGQCHKK